jgi:hypothetical protein
MRKRDRKIPQAHAAEWMGLCPCGCGAYKVVLLDEHDNAIATFGWDREDWIAFIAGVVRQIDGESNDAVVCENHTSH